ncbi:hypothetical protein O181_091057 [Austropuccinia psidii MF-1]|uniref:Uncharacterized protein n=1 Tax=Austropuccinia psidii MF-1 TaxID=1389203 RepID=A0A9Q3IWR9_9BASI|nr:hypothetical protein [Austropuccinia psidii MF-1]
MVLQGFPIVSNLSILIEFGTDILDLVTGSRQRNVARCTNVGGPIPVGARLIYSSSEVPISRINTEGVVKRIRVIAYSPTDPDAEGSDELPTDSKFMSFPVPPELSNPLLLLFLLFFLQIHQVLPIPGLP